MHLKSLEVQGIELKMEQDAKEYFKQYKTQEISQNELITFFLSNARQYDVPLESYHNLMHFKSYQSKYSSIDPQYSTPARGRQ